LEKAVDSGKWMLSSIFGFFTPFSVWIQRLPVLGQPTMAFQIVINLTAVVDTFFNSTALAFPEADALALLQAGFPHLLGLSCIRYSRVISIV
ncbi:hypothetical protein, partial [Faecalibaculum rodentium]